ncbi:hypothetical protein PYCCODRAFT_201414 [Trametes coccinea BRFM310]|uniref:Uncharacterized protein n=1 Tax=Trametes coccinea (strain BRFM310) TaxID=1353009 RepID=A0A1Y2IRU6_TRAC3|nr:hypothetical protein PYCCODRAFT_201414 [Trametes coccinea BRFM310]
MSSSSSRSIHRFSSSALDTHSILAASQRRNLTQPSLQALACTTLHATTNIVCEQVDEALAIPSNPGASPEVLAPSRRTFTARPSLPPPSHLLRRATPRILAYGSTSRGFLFATCISASLPTALPTIAASQALCTEMQLERSDATTNTSYTPPHGHARHLWPPRREATKFYQTEFRPEMRRTARNARQRAQR